MRKFKLTAIAIALIMVVSIMASCAGNNQAAAPAPEPEKPAAEAPAAAEESSGGSGGPRGPGEYPYHLGLVQPGPEFYYQTFTDSKQVAAEFAGMTVTALLAEYSPDKEISNVEDLIARGVDAISIFSVSSDTAQRDAQLGEEAGIPFFLTNSTLGEGPADVISMIGNSFFEMGEMNGNWVKDNLDIFPAEIKILEIQGQLGQGVAEGISDGFASVIDKLDNATIVHKQTANWVRSEAITITEDSLMANLDFNAMFVHNEDMTEGVVETLKENGVLKDIIVMAQNGSDPGIAMIKAGELTATCANPPSFTGGDVIVQILRHFDGLPVPRVYNSPVFMIDSTNVNDPNLVTWDKKWAITRVEAYFAGTYE